MSAIFPSEYYFSLALYILVMSPHLAESVFVGVLSAPYYSISPVEFSFCFCSGTQGVSLMYLWVIYPFCGGSCKSWGREALRGVSVWNTGLVGKEESVCPIILTPIRFYLLLQLAVAEDVWSLSVPHIGPFKRGLRSSFCFHGAYSPVGTWVLHACVNCSQPSDGVQSTGWDHRAWKCWHRQPGDVRT